MLIKPITTVTGIHLEMSVDEAIEIAKSVPASTELRRKIKDMLSGLGYDIETGLRDPRVTAVRLDVLPEVAETETKILKEKKLIKESEKIERTKKGEGVRVSRLMPAICPWCGGTYSKKGIKRHLHYCNKRQDQISPATLIEDALDQVVLDEQAVVGLAGETVA